MLDFLRSVLPIAPVYLVAYPTPAGMKHVILDSIEAVANVSQSLVSQGHDVYYALSGYERGWYPNPSPEDPDRQSLRTQSNAISQKALWLDIDVGVDKDYASLDEAYASLNSFISAAKLPAPTVVHSGNGLHIYWTLSQDIQSDQWQDLAGRLKSATVSLGMRVDQSRTADRASVLRVPGTYNFKDRSNPKPVSVTQVAQPVDVVTLQQILSPYESTQVVGALPSYRPPHILAAVATGTGMLQVATNTNESNAKMVADNCRQIRECGSSIEPAWFGALTVLSRCEGGHELAHQLSAMDPRYSHGGTEEKYYHAMQAAGPMLCSSFEAQEPSKCHGCPHYGKVKSPISLGVTYERTAPTLAADPEVVENAHDTLIEGQVIHSGETLVLNDFGGYTHENGQVWFHKPAKGNAPATRELLFHSMPRPLYILREIEDKVQTIFYMWEINTQGYTEVIKMDSEAAASQTRMISFLSSIRMLPPPTLHREAYNYMSLYILELQRKLPTVKKHERFGWSSGRLADGTEIPTFISGLNMLTANNPPVEVEFAGSTLDYAKDTLGKKGTIEGWKKGISAYHKEDMWAWFGISLGFAAPLMKFYTSTAQNGIVNFYSSESGTGKSTLQQAVASIWGHPVDQIISNTTHNARLEMMGIRRNLPMILDEITGIEREELSELIFNMANGTGKLRLGADSSIKPVRRWETISITSANNTLLDKLLAMSSSREGEQMRALDVFVPKDANRSRRDFEAIFQNTKSNYGVAGDAFIQFILDNEKLYKGIPALLAEESTFISDAPQDRFWANTIAAAVLAAVLTNEMGLTDIDVDALRTYGRSVMAKQSHTLANNRQTPLAVISDFIAAKRPNTLAVTTAERPASMPMPTVGSIDPYVIQQPIHQAIELRHEVDSGVVYISATAFKEWLRYKNHGFSYIMENLKKLGILESPRAARTYLTAGTRGESPVRLSTYKLLLKNFEEVLEKIGANDEQN